MPAALPLGRRERKKQAIRDKICEETIGLVERHGIEGTTIDAICDCTDIAKKTFYNYYSSKHDLLIDICQTNLLSRTELLITDAMAQSDDLNARLDFIFTIIIQRNREAGHLEKQLIDYMVGNLSNNRSQGAGQLTFMNGCFLRLYDSNKRQIKTTLSAQFCAEMTVGMINAVTLNWLHSDQYETEQKFMMLRDYIKSSMVNN